MPVGRTALPNGAEVYSNKMRKRDHTASPNIWSRSVVNGRA